MPMQKMVNGVLVDFTPEEEAARLIEIEQARLDKWPSKKAWAKEEAGRLILAIAPEWKQRNAAARLAELQAIRLGTYLLDDGAMPPAREWTSEESAEVLAIRRLWDTIKAIRARSNEIEGLVDAIDPSSPTADADLEKIVW